MAINHFDLLQDLVFPLWKDRQYSVIDRYCSPQIDVRTTFLTGIGTEAVKKSVQDIFSIFPDFQLSLTHIAQEDNKLTYEWDATGIQEKPVLGILPTGRKIQFSGVVYGEINNDLVTVYHNYSNILQTLHASAPLRPILNSGQLLNTNQVVAKHLTAREIECLDLWLRGCSMKETAKQLGGVSTRTVQTYRNSIKDKLKLKNYQQLLSMFAEQPLFP
jgi:DNA-binding CsgD family transcriptional regulator